MTFSNQPSENGIITIIVLVVIQKTEAQSMKSESAEENV